jgi:hypothetical protein
MLVHNVLLYERSCLEQLLTALAPELIVVLDLDVVFAESCQLAVIALISQSPATARQSEPTPGSSRRQSPPHRPYLSLSEAVPFP